MLNFISFGSGSSGNCYYLFNDAFGILIDTGIGVRTLKKHFRDCGLSLSKVRYIIVTHDHADHVKAVGRISSELNIPVYATALVHEGIERNYCVHKKIAPANKRMMEKGGTLRLTGEPDIFASTDNGDGEMHCAVVTSFDVPHDSNDNVGYRIMWEGKTFCLMTDAGHVTDEMKRYIGEAEYLVIEANHDIEMLMGGSYPLYLKTRVSGERGHLSNSDCAIAIAENASPLLRYVWLCHLSQENNHPELARKTVAMMLRKYGIVADKDFMLEPLKRNTPSEIYELV